MPKLYELIQSEYKTEYIGEYQKSEDLMEKKKYTAPKIYPKIISEKTPNCLFRGGKTTDSTEI